MLPGMFLLLLVMTEAALIAVKVLITTVIRFLRIQMTACGTVFLSTVIVNA